MQPPLASATKRSSLNYTGMLCLFFIKTYLRDGHIPITDIPSAMKFMV